MSFKPYIIAHLQRLLFFRTDCQSLLIAGAISRPTTMVIQREYGAIPWWNLWPQTPLQTAAHSSSFFDDPFSGFLGRRKPFLTSCGAEFRQEQCQYQCDWSDNDRQVPVMWSERGRNFVNRFYDSVFGGLYEDSELDISDFSDDEDEMRVTGEELHRVPWIPSLCLTMQDKRELMNRSMLSDKHMYAGQKLLKAQYPDMGGLQDTCLAQTEFQPEQRRGVQIHHTRGNHWVLSSTNDGDEVNLYDSMYDNITADLYKQLQQIYKVDQDNKVVYRLPDIQKQRGSRDCGLFVVAFAIELCEGNDPTDAQFQQRNMRKHLLNCFEEGRLVPFPKEQEH